MPPIVGINSLVDILPLIVFSMTLCDGAGKKKLLQRSLAPHLDCCPTDLYGFATRDNEGVGGDGPDALLPRWRPIQATISLTDTLSPNEGGFEAVLGFHREFEDYFNGGTTPSPSTSAGSGGGVSSESNSDSVESTSPKIMKSDVHPLSPTLCVGQFTALRSKEDSAVVERYTHVPAKAGSAVFWDWRIPHANSRYFVTAETPSLTHSYPLSLPSPLVTDCSDITNLH
jgi:hypothetical protein